MHPSLLLVSLPSPHPPAATAGPVPTVVWVALALLVYLVAPVWCARRTVRQPLDGRAWARTR